MQPAPRPVRLSDRVRAVLRVRHYSLRTEQTYLSWMTRFVKYHQGRHPDAMGAPEVVAFLTHLAVDGRSVPQLSARLRARWCFSIGRYWGES